jgi:hypothetical protein
MQIDVKKLTKEEMQIRIILLKAMIRENKRKIKRLITDKKPEEAILLTLKTDDMKQVVKMLKREMGEASE